MAFNVDLSKVPYHPTSEKIAKHLSSTVQNNDLHLFRTMLTYFFGSICGHMRVGVSGFGSDVIPANIYSMCLSASGTGKGVTLKTVDSHILNEFKNIFMDETFMAAAEIRVAALASERADKRGTHYDEEYEKLIAEFNSSGSMVYQFAEGTAAGIKQIRHKLTIANLGAYNFRVDEIGLNLLGIKELVTLYLELYDTGSVEDKLIKNTADNTRMERIEGSTPASMLLTGEPTALFDGAETEDKFFAFLNAGYARRCFFSLCESAVIPEKQSAAQLIKNMRSEKRNTALQDLSLQFAQLADITNANKVLELEEHSAIHLMEYKLHCLERASKFKQTQTLQRNEMTHRYFKVLKLATAYAFGDGLDEVTIEYLNYAIKLAEDSGAAFEKIVNPEKPYMKLAKYLATNPDSSTLADLDQELPYFRGSKQTKEELISNAVSWGYKNNIVISKHWIDQILFLKGSQLEETSLDDLIMSTSTDLAEDYEPEEDLSFEDLALTGETLGLNFCNHYFVDNHRHIENLKKGFNFVVLDVDDGTPMKSAEIMLRDYWFILYETKRSTPEYNRYRILIPISHVLELDREDYADFMRNLIEDLPFEIEVDSASLQPEKKWLTNNKSVYINDTNSAGSDPKLLDALAYLPRTRKNEVRMQRNAEYKDLDRIDRWFLEHTYEGNRNNQVYRYAAVLADMNCDMESIKESTKLFNSRLKNPLNERELDTSIFKSIAKKIS